MKWLTLCVFLAAAFLSCQSSSTRAEPRTAPTSGISGLEEVRIDARGME